MGQPRFAGVGKSGRKKRGQSPFRKGTVPFVSGRSKPLERFAVWTTRWVGSSWAFLIALVLTVLWLVSGPFFRYSDTWQLVMNTISSIVTFLMVFLIQRSHNKESLAMQIKLNELLAAAKGASNQLINIEEWSEAEVREVHRRFQQLAERVRGGDTTTSVQSLEEPMTSGELAPEPQPLPTPSLSSVTG